MDATIVTYKEARASIVRIVKASLACKAANKVNTVIIDGPPGCGKTTLAQYIQQDTGLKHLYMIKPGHHDYIDFNGLPMGDMATKTAHFFPFNALLPSPDLKGGCILLADEAGIMDRQVQNIWRQILNEGKLQNGYVLPENTFHILTANRVADRAGSQRIQTNVGNVVAWFSLRPQMEELFEYGLAHGWNPTVLAFLKLMGNIQINQNDRAKDGWEPPTYFNSFDPSDAAQMVKPSFASSRSIEFVSNHMNYIDEHERNIDNGSLLCDVASMIGTPWAAKFVPFRNEANTMPDPDKILRGDNVPFPKLQSVMWALTIALQSRAVAKNWKHLDNFLKQGPLEYRVLAVRNCFDTRIHQVAGPDFQITLQDPDIKQAMKAK